jgi:hypothetical protein
MSALAIALGAILYLRDRKRIGELDSYQKTGTTNTCSLLTKDDEK